MSGRGGRRGGRGGIGRGHCSNYKYLGECEKHNRGECSFRHELILRNTCREYIEIPPGMTAGMVIGSKGCNLKQLYSIAQCCIKVDEDKVLIVTEKQRDLALLVEKMKQILFQEHVSGPSWIYINPSGISRQASYSFVQYQGRAAPRAQAAHLTMYALHSDLKQEIVGDDESDLVRRLAAMSPSTEHDTSDGLRSTLQAVHGHSPGGAERTKWKHKIRVHLEPYVNIKKTLTESLKVLCEKRRQENIVTRLDARFGKVTWGKLPEEMYTKKYDIESLAELLFAEDAKLTNIFNTDVKSANAESVRSVLGREESHYLETLDVKVTSFGRVGGEEKEARLDVRLLIKRRDDGQNALQVVMVKKKEIKDVIFDTINLHRQHDVRIGLHHYEVVQDGDPYYGVVKEMISRITFLPRHMIRIQPKTSRWNVHFIRHKKKMTYIVDESFAVTIATVSEHSFDSEKDEPVNFDLRDKGHTEVELHNLTWECAFGRDAGFHPDQSLAIHIRRGSTNTREFDTIPHPWQTDNILRDFERFCGHLESLSEKLDGTL